MRCTVAAVAALAAASTGGSAPGAVGNPTCTPGLHRLDLGGESTALVLVTPRATNAKRALLLVLHDAGGSEREGLSVFRSALSLPGLVLVAPRARGTTWSFERGRGADLATVGHALTQVFSGCAVDSRRVGIGGFAEGATSALLLGMTNGRLFHGIIAVAPGSIGAQRRVGSPRIYIAHGTGDTVAPFADTRDVLVPTLRHEGYAVTFRPFAGGHTVPAAVARAALRWFLS